ncbi:MAG TPA: hypothetical protein VE955_01495 [Candidatus Dormibacteraeota bacterium]|jgi:hypothetical protein|nr:hypothetical protein [Candidatus Dormibacteraeota bacterium]
MSSAELTRLSSKSIDDLYEELGHVIVAPEYPKGAAVSRQVAVQRGRSFLSGAMDSLRNKICSEWHYCSKRGEYSTFQSLVSAIAPLVSNVAGVPASAVMIITVLLVKVGLDNLCHCPST